LKKLIAVVVTGLALFTAGTASAAVTHPKLNAIASQFAGRPVSVSCELSDYDWDIRDGWYGVYGFYYPPEADWVFLSPAACAPLLTALNAGIKDAGLSPLGLGLLVLLHESFHARGFVNEAQTEACAMRSLPEELSAFGIGPTKTVAIKQLRYRVHRRKVGKRVIRFRTSRVVTVYRTVANDDHSRILDWAAQWHAEAPPEYQNGTC
jgi:hypothetical protein